jgi:hypothetical protein
MIIGNVPAAGAAVLVIALATLLVVLLTTLVADFTADLAIFVFNYF